LNSIFLYYFAGCSTYLNKDDSFDILGFGRPNIILKNIIRDKGYGIFLNVGYYIETNKGFNFSITLRNILVGQPIY